MSGSPDGTRTNDDHNGGVVIWLLSFLITFCCHSIGRTGGECCEWHTFRDGDRAAGFVAFARTIV